MFKDCKQDPVFLSLLLLLRLLLRAINSNINFHLLPLFVAIVDCTLP